MDGTPVAEEHRADEDANTESSVWVERSAPITIDGLTVVFEVTYIGGPAGDRLAARQADAIAALLDWVEGQEPER